MDNVEEHVSLLAARLRGAATIDEVAVATLRSVARFPGVVRAALGISVAGGRELRFVSSDEDRLSPAPEWCLIDAYDRLPLNDAVRTGRDVVLATPDSFGSAYPDLAGRQSDPAVRSLLALALRSGQRRLGGLLLYCDHDLPRGPRDAGEVPAGLAPVAGLVARALGAAWTAGDPADGPALPADGATPHRRLPDDETAPGLARRFLREVLTAWQLDEESLDAALLCATELVTNVVMHAGRASVIAVERAAGAITVQVRHAPGERLPPVRGSGRPDPLPIAGRGLVIVEAMASDWGSRTHGTETCVWFRLERAGDPAARR